jgi:serine/threonine protein kinase
MPSIPPPTEARPLGPYTLLRRLGRGGFAPVWLAEESYRGKRLRVVAIKLFELPRNLAPASPEAAAWLDAILDEARALCRVEHPAIVRFHALERDDVAGRVGLVMEYVPGKSLDVELRENGKLENAAVIDVAIAMAWALAAVHEAALVHRDVKPANILRGPHGYKLIDFGIAAGTVGHASDRAPPSVAPESLRALRPLPSRRFAPGTFVSQIVGTPGYMAPECAALGAAPTPAADLYGLGATLFELRAGHVPAAMVDPGRKLSISVLCGAMRPPRLDEVVPGVPRALADLVAQLLDPDPAARPCHADWVARTLQSIRLDERDTLPPPAPAPSVPPPPRLTLETSETVRVDPAVLELPRDTPLVARLEQAAQRRKDGGRASVEPVARPALVGRGEALAAVARAIEAARAGDVAFVLVTGPLGIGRSRIVEAALERATPSAAWVLRIEGSPERRGPLRPFIRALEASGTAALAPAREAAVRAIAPDALGSGPAEPGDALEGVEAALLAACQDKPGIIAFDDAQWADPHSLALLRLLAGRAGERAGRLVVIAAVRNEPHPPSPLRALLAATGSPRRSGLFRVPLGPLADEEAEALAQAVCPLEPDLAQAIARDAGGVPFFVVHAISALHQAGSLSFRNGAWFAADERMLREGVPGVSDLLSARLAGCFDPKSPEGRAAPRVLAAVALAGAPLAADVLLSLGEDAHGVETALEALIDAGILDFDAERQEVTFAQEMVRQAALNLSRQRPWFFRLHRALLDALAAGRGGPPSAVFLATGYEKLGAADEARTWLGRAMDEAVGAGLFSEAADLADRLVALLPAEEARAAVELDAVRALVQGRRFEEARERLGRLSTRAGALLARPEGRALDVRRRIHALEVARGLRDAEALDATLVADADALGDLGLRAEARLAVAGVSRDERALALAEEAIALASARGEVLEFRARVLRSELNFESNRPSLELAEEDLRRALAIAQALGSAWHRVHVEGDLAVLEAEQGRMGKAIARLRRLVPEAAGMRSQQRLLLHTLSVLLLRAGENVEAADTASRTAALSTGDPVLEGAAHSLRAEALRRARRLPEALVEVDLALALQRGGDPTAALSLMRRAQILSAMGRGEEARADAEEARGLAEAHGDRDLVIAASLWIALGRVRRDPGAMAELADALWQAESAEVTLKPLTVGLVEEARLVLTSGGKA